jgi:hypothetical protein
MCFGACEPIHITCVYIYIYACVYVQLCIFNDKTVVDRLLKFCVIVHYKETSNAYRKCVYENNSLVFRSTKMTVTNLEFK